MEAWRLGTEDARTLLGAPPERTYYARRLGNAVRVPQDMLKRIGYVAGIYKALQIVRPIDGRRLGPSAEQRFRRYNAVGAAGRRRRRSRGGSQLRRRRSRSLELRVATHRVRWCQAWRIIATRYPPIRLFECLTPDPAVWEALLALEQMTNPRVRGEVGDISLVPADQANRWTGSELLDRLVHPPQPKWLALQRRSYGDYYAPRSSIRRSPKRCFSSKDQRAIVGIPSGWRICASLLAPSTKTSTTSPPCLNGNAQEFCARSLMSTLRRVPGGYESPARTAWFIPACVALAANVLAHSSPAPWPCRNRSGI
jgi:hypothetical protein